MIVIITTTNNTSLIPFLSTPTNTTINTTVIIIIINMYIIIFNKVILEIPYRSKSIYKNNRCKYKIYENPFNKERSRDNMIY